MTWALLPLFAQATAAPTLNVSMLVVLGIILVALVFFITEWLPIDITAIGVMVLVMLLEPWTQVSPSEGIAGFASTATITVLAMFVLSEGVRRTGVLQRIGNRIVEWSGGHPIKQFSAVIGLSGSMAGIVNNTPVVHDDTDGDEYRAEDEDLAVEAAHAAVIRVHDGRDAHPHRHVDDHSGE
jgi:di/tricarboxylate transporter